MVNKDQLNAQNILIEELRQQIADLKEKVASLEKKQESYEQKAKNNISEATTWAKVLSSETKKNEYHTNVLNVVGIEKKERKKKERSVMVFGLPASTASTSEAKQKEDQTKLNDLFNSLQLYEKLGEQIEKVQRFKTPSDPDKIAPIQVTFKMDGNGGPMYTATEITKAAKCLKDNPNFKSVYINPDLTQSQQIHLKRLIKERTQKNSTLNLTTSTFRYGIRGDQVVKIKNIV